MHSADQAGSEALQRQSDPEIIDRLLEAGAAIAGSEWDSPTALHRASGGSKRDESDGP